MESAAVRELLPHYIAARIVGSHAILLGAIGSRTLRWRSQIRRRRWARVRLR